MRISTLGIFLAGIATSLIGAILLTPLAVAAAPAVTTPKGIFPAQTYAGVAKSGITDFLGIRFAAPPVGNLRFAAPAPPPAVAGTISAAAFGSPCPQSASPFGSESTNEDCLFLNIYVPGSSVSAGNNLPVMVFFYGGDFVYGKAVSTIPAIWRFKAMSS